VAQADEFRVETDVYVGNQEKPIAENVTLFTNGLVYDFPLTGPEEITVFDPSRGRFVLLDCRRKVKTTLTTRDLVEFTSALKAHAAETDGVFAFAANPRFRHEHDPKTEWLTLSGDSMTYRAKGITPNSESAVSTYRSFADWYARLNATRPGSLPPFARLKLNEAIAKEGWIPKEVELTVTPKMRVVGRKLVMRSHHAAVWQLSATDRDRIDKAAGHMVSFQAVGFQDYRKESQVAAK
jgi:hypothetical protein